MAVFRARGQHCCHGYWVSSNRKGIANCTLGENQWECFSGDPDNITREDIRIIPLGVAIGLDSSLKNIFEMEIEDGFLRNDKDCWIRWE